MCLMVGTWLMLPNWEGWALGSRALERLVRGLCEEWDDDKVMSERDYVTGRGCVSGLMHARELMTPPLSLVTNLPGVLGSCVY